MVEGMIVFLIGGVLGFALGMGATFLLLACVGMFAALSRLEAIERDP